VNDTLTQLENNNINTSQLLEWKKITARSVNSQQKEAVPHIDTGVGNGTQLFAIYKFCATEYIACMKSVVPELEIICN
jgi:hypothetical protein